MHKCKKSNHLNSRHPNSRCIWIADILSVRVLEFQHALWQFGVFKFRIQGSSFRIVVHFQSSFRATVCKLDCCVFWPANGCSTRSLLVKTICFCVKTSFLYFYVSNGKKQNLKSNIKALVDPLLWHVFLLFFAFFNIFWLK